MAMLDAIGLDKKDSGGFRVMSNGDRLSFEICVWEGFSGWMDSTEMAIKDWEDIGIHATMKVGHRAQIGQQWNNNECMAQATSMDSAGLHLRGQDGQHGYRLRHLGPAVG